MARPLRSVLSLQGVTPAERQFATRPTCLDLELPRGEVALVQVDDEADATALVDLCVGLVDPGAGQARFRGVDWTTRTPRERLNRRRRIGAIAHTDVWPSHMTVMEAVLVARFYHFDQPRDEVVAEATELARLFGLPYAPITPTFPWLGPLGLIPLPSKWIIEFGAPIPTDGHGPGSADDPMLVFDLTDQVRETIQQTLYTLLMQRRSVFF